MEMKQGRVVVADAEKQGIVMTNGQREVWVSPADFMNGAVFREFPDVTLLLIEAAHMAERKKYSLAQILTAEQLVLFQKNHVGIEVRLLPEMLAKKIRGDEFERQDSAQAWWHYINTAQAPVGRHLMRFRIMTPEELAIEEAANEQRFDLTVRLNVERYDKYTGKDSQRALAILDTATMSENLLYWTGYYRGPRGGLKWRETFVMSIYMAVYNEDGSLKTSPDGRVIGRRWLWKVLKMHPYHRKAGTARSNLMHHVLRNVEIRVTDGRETRFADCQAARASFRQAIKELHRIFVNAGSYAPAIAAGSTPPATPVAA